uniref:Uncharacterized protein n=1 Tax=Cereibacter sphaeroides (strain ATCC 17025 / ATH 2.4.3) TaxID=349102 RepID=A4X022_CERS5
MRQVMTQDVVADEVIGALAERPRPVERRTGIASTVAANLAVPRPDCREGEEPRRPGIDFQIERYAVSQEGAHRVSRPTLPVHVSPAISRHDRNLPTPRPAGPPQAPGAGRFG